MLQGKPACVGTQHNHGVLLAEKNMCFSLVQICQCVINDRLEFFFLTFLSS